MKNLYIVLMAFCGLSLQAGLVTSRFTDPENKVCRGFHVARKASKVPQEIHDSHKAVFFDIEPGIYFKDLTAVAQHCHTLSGVRMRQILSEIKKERSEALKFCEPSQGIPYKSAHSIDMRDIEPALYALALAFPKSGAHVAYAEFLQDQKQLCIRAATAYDNY